MTTRIWLISDTHFGHENAYAFLRADGVTRMRHEWANAAEADAYMLAQWRDKVRAEDHVYHLGDVAMHMAPWVATIKGLPGHKRLILGNHDRGKTSEYMAAGFQRILGSRHFGGRDRRVVLSHIPLHPGSIHGINIHGHIHEKVVVTEEGVADPRYINVSVEQTGYSPVLLNNIAEEKGFSL